MVGGSLRPALLHGKNTTSTAGISDCWGSRGEKTAIRL